MLNTETQISWQDYLTIISRRRWYFILPCALIIGGALTVGGLLPRIYRAETIIQVQEPQIMNPLIQGLAISTPVGARLRTLREELLSWTSLTRLVHELGMDTDTKSAAAQEQLIKKLQQDIEVRMSGPELVHIYYENPDPKLAQHLVNTISTIFLKRNMEAQSSETGTAISFIEQEMASYKEKLEASEKTLREFKELYTTQMPVATELNTQIIDLEVALTQILIDSTEEHPVVINTRKRIAELKAKRNVQIKEVIAAAIAKGQDPSMVSSLLAAMDHPATANTADPKVKLAQEAYASLVEQMETHTPKSGLQATTQVQIVTAPKGQGPELLGNDATSISLGPWQEQELSRLTRDYEVYAANYRNLQERLERARVTKNLGESDEGLKFKILEPARLPIKPVKPNMTKILAFALFLGLFTGAGVAFLAEYMDQSFQSASDLQSTLSLPVLGTISRIVTEDDLAARRHRVQAWFTIHGWRARIAQITTPITQRVNRQLLKWGL